MVKPLEKVNEVFGIVEDLASSTSKEIIDITLDNDKQPLMKYLYNDFMEARKSLNEIINMGKSSISYVSAEIDDPRATEALSSLISSVNTSIKTLMDIYITVDKLQGKEDKDKVGRITNQVNIISTNLNEVIKNIKNNE